MQVPQLKHCPICSKDLEVSEFGICRARKDGRNLYCRSCIRQKVAQNRIGQRSWRQVRNERRKKLWEELKEIHVAKPQSEVLSAKQSPVELVRDAIRRGFKTQKEIEQETKLVKDEIGDAIAQLLLWTKEIVTRGEGYNRIYLPTNLVATELTRKTTRTSAPLMEFAKSEFGPVMKHERVA